MLTSFWMETFKVFADAGVSLQFRDSMDPVISHYELQGNTVVIQADAVSNTTLWLLGSF